MSEAIEKTIYESPLAAIHREAGAEMVERDESIVPFSYGDAAREYEAVRGVEAGIIDLSPERATLEVSGAEAERFLNGMVTNDVAKLSVGAWMLAAFPNVQGRLIGFARFLRLAPDSFLLDTDRATHARVLSALERFTLAGDFHVRDTSGEQICLSLQGARSAELMSAAFGAEFVADVERGRTGTAAWEDSPVIVIRDTHTGEDGFDLFMGASGAPDMWKWFVDSGARPVGYDALEILRIEAGLLRYGADMSDANVVLETGLDEAVSFTKGCYLGQEIIARIHFRGHVARRLAGLRFERETSSITRGATLKSTDGKDAGHITSVARSPRLNESIALASVRYAYLAPGTELRASDGDGGEAAARVVELPFVRGSWFEASEA